MKLIVLIQCDWRMVAATALPLAALSLRHLLG